jgi:hypothetical protein
MPAHAFLAALAEAAFAGAAQLQATVNSSYHQLQLLAFYSTIRYHSNPAWQASSVLQYSVPNYPAVFLIVIISMVGMQIFCLCPQFTNLRILGLIP